MVELIEVDGCDVKLLKIIRGRSRIISDADILGGQGKARALARLGDYPFKADRVGGSLESTS